MQAKANNSILQILSNQNCFKHPNSLITDFTKLHCYTTDSILIIHYYLVIGTLKLTLDVKVSLRAGTLSFESPWLVLVWWYSYRLRPVSPLTSCSSWYSNKYPSVVCKIYGKSYGSAHKKVAFLQKPRALQKPPRQCPLQVSSNTLQQVDKFKAPWGGI